MELTMLNDGRRVLAKRDKYGIGAKTFANLTQAHKAAEKAKTEFPDAVVSVTGHRPYYVTVREWSDLFEQCCEDFRNEIVALANDHGKTVQQVYAWWREYSDACSAGDQSALVWEFKRWYAAKLGPLTQVALLRIREKQVECKAVGDWDEWQRLEQRVRESEQAAKGPALSVVG